MKTFVVEGCNWNTVVDIDEDIFPKYTDMATEAMTVAVERFLKNKIPNKNDEELGLGLILTSYEKGHKGDLNKEFVSLTELILRNAGCPDLAEQAKQVAMDAIRKDAGEL